MIAMTLKFLVKPPFESHSTVMIESPITIRTTSDVIWIMSTLSVVRLSATFTPEMPLTARIRSRTDRSLFALKSSSIAVSKFVGM